MTFALEINGLGKKFGGFTAVNSIDLAIPSKQRCALLGPNGAGKTTLLNLISGRLKPTSGSIKVDGKDVTHATAMDRAHLGVGRSFQKTNIFAGLSLLENVRLGLHARDGIRNWNPVIPIDSDSALNDEANAMLRHVNLRRKPSERADTLSYGEQRQLELAITLATKPKIVLLDEPTAGMSPSETSAILELLAELLQELTVVIVEHDLRVVDRIAHRIVVLERGTVIADGSPEVVKSDAVVQRAYLKGAHHA